MKLWHFAIYIGLFVLAALPTAAQKPETYPSDEDVNLLMNQADRAMADYQRVVTQAKSLMGEASDTATDVKLLDTWKIVRASFSKEPQKFNSFAGFDVVTMIDDAARTVSLISNTVAREVMRQITGGKITNQTDLLVTLMQNANSVGTLLFTVSENGADLYRKYLRWEENMTGQAVRERDKCSKLLKK